MTSKEALRTIYINCKDLLVDKNSNVVRLEYLVKIILQDLVRLEKLEEAIEILKDKFYLRVHSNMFGSWLFIKEKIKNGKDVSCELDLDIVDTIKEVFGNG